MPGIRDMVRSSIIFVTGHKEKILCPLCSPLTTTIASSASSFKALAFRRRLLRSCSWLGCVRGCQQASLYASATAQHAQEPEAAPRSALPCLNSVPSLQLGLPGLAAAYSPRLFPSPLLRLRAAFSRHAYAYSGVLRASCRVVQSGSWGLGFFRDFQTKPGDGEGLHSASQQCGGAGGGAQSFPRRQRPSVP